MASAAAAAGAGAACVTSVTAAAGPFTEPFRGLDRITLGHVLSFACPFLLPTPTVRALCRALQEEYDSGGFHREQFGAWAPSPAALAAACLGSLLRAPDLQATQTRLPLPAGSATVKRGLGPPTCLDVKGSFAAAGFANGETLVLSLPRNPNGLYPTTTVAAAAGGEGTTPRVVHRIVGHRGRVSAVALLSGGRVLTGGDGEQEGAVVKLWAPPSSSGGNRLLRTFSSSWSLLSEERGGPAPPANGVAGLRSRLGTSSCPAAVEAIICEDPDLFVLSSSGGHLRLTWHDLYTGNLRGPPLGFEEEATAATPGRVRESLRRGCLVWNGERRQLFIGGSSLGDVAVVRASEGAGELELMGVLLGQQGPSPSPALALQIYTIFKSRPNTSASEGEKHTRLVAGYADGRIAMWALPPSADAVDDAAPAFLRGIRPAARACLALDAVAGSGVVLASFYGSPLLCLDMERIVPPTRLPVSQGSRGKWLLELAGVKRWRWCRKYAPIDAAADVEVDSKRKKFQKQLYLRSSTELAPGLFPHPHPITCLQLQRSTGRLVLGLMDGSLRLVGMGRQQQKQPKQKQEAAEGGGKKRAKTS